MSESTVLVAVVDCDFGINEEHRVVIWRPYIPNPDGSGRQLMGPYFAIPMPLIPEMIRQLAEGLQQLQGNLGASSDRTN